MKFFIILLLVLVNYGVCSAQDIGSFIPIDKRIHALASYVICDMAKDHGASKYDKFWIITGFGFGKEILDSQSGGEFDYADIIADYVGFIIEGTGIIYHNGDIIIKNEWLF